MNTPVALTLFNNPESVRKVFARIRDARPPMLFLISDAGRNPNEQVLVAQSRKAAEAVDWECEVFKNYAEHNMGARERLSSGISWVFEHVDRAIIFEHDCLPDPSFFPFCEELLERYKDDTRVMHIGGTNFHQHNRAFHPGESYYFSLIPQIWGFATWRRAWQHYDVTLSKWPQVKEKKILDGIFTDPAVLDRWSYLFEKYYKGEVNSWDGQWTFACLINHGLSVTPSANLVTNIGFGPRALTTHNVRSAFANLFTIPMHFPLTHPSVIAPDATADAYIQKHLFDVRRTLRDKIKWGLLRHIPGADYFWRILKGRR